MCVAEETSKMLASLQSHNYFTEQPVASSVRNRRLLGEKMTLDDGRGKHPLPLVVLNSTTMASNRQ